MKMKKRFYFTKLRRRVSIARLQARARAAGKKKECVAWLAGSRGPGKWRVVAAYVYV
jgi:hypothetical protein